MHEIDACADSESSPASHIDTPEPLRRQAGPGLRQLLDRPLQFGRRRLTGHHFVVADAGAPQRLSFTASRAAAVRLGPRIAPSFAEAAAFPSVCLRKSVN
jgi:hypothetical protein